MNLACTISKADGIEAWSANIPHRTFDFGRGSGFGTVDLLSAS
jgi:hypothetical protein